MRLYTYPIYTMRLYTYHIQWDYIRTIHNETIYNGQLSSLVTFVIGKSQSQITYVRMTSIISHSCALSNEWYTHTTRVHTCCLYIFQDVKDWLKSGVGCHFSFPSSYIYNKAWLCGALSLVLHITCCLIKDTAGSVVYLPNNVCSCTKCLQLIILA